MQRPDLLPPAPSTQHCSMDWHDRRCDAWSRLLLASIMVIFSCVLVRVFLLKTSPDPRLADVTSSTTSTKIYPGWRGSIYDVRGRIIASTWNSRRVFLDPHAHRQQRARRNIDEDLGRVCFELARALGLPGCSLDSINEQSHAFAAHIASRLDRHPETRYIQLTGPLDAEQLTVIQAAELDGIGFERVAVREYVASPSVQRLVGRVRTHDKDSRDHTGLSGLELILEQRLRPEHGRFSYVRDARGRFIHTDEIHQISRKGGEDIYLTLDSMLQNWITGRLQEAMLAHNAGGARAVVIDARTGGILAMTDVINHDRSGTWPHSVQDPIRNRQPGRGRNRCATDTFEPGSTFKPFVWSIAVERGVVTQGEMLDLPEHGPWTTSYGRTIRDVRYRGPMTWSNVLFHSQNAGMAMVSERLSQDALRHGIGPDGFGFGRITSLSLPQEHGGIVTSASGWTRYSQSSVAIGQEIAVTILQMAQAFTAFTSGGSIIPLRLTRASEADTDLPIRVQIISMETALQARQAMSRVMAPRPGRPEGLWPPSYMAFGKSGTAQMPDPDAGTYYQDRYTSNFIAAAPIDDPRIIAMCVIDDPDRSRGSHYGSATAGPVVRDILEQALRSLGIPAERMNDQAVPAGTSFIALR